MRLHLEADRPVWRPAHAPAVIPLAGADAAVLRQTLGRDDGAPWPEMAGRTEEVIR